MARQELHSPFQSFVAGRQARQSENYAATRNKLAEMELADAPAQMQRRNALADLQLHGAQQNVQGQQQQLNAEQAKFAYAKLKQAQDSGNPKAFITSQIPELAAKLQEKGIDLATMDDQAVAQLTENLARKYAGDAGIAPASPIQSQNIGGMTVLTQDGKYLNAASQRGQDGFTLSPGETRFGSDGKPIASRPAAPKPAQPNWTRIEQTMPDGKVQVGFVDTNSPNPEATFRPIGSPSITAKDPKVTEGERVAANYLLRMESAEPSIGGYTPSTKDMLLYNKALNSGDVVAFLANEGISPEGQQFFQSVTDWSRAKLRKESGAVISPSEIISEVRTYFPVAGDSPKLIEQKRKSRSTAVDGMRLMAGSAAKQARKEAPAAAIEHLRQHPELKEQFKSKYGYLPDGL